MYMNSTRPAVYGYQSLVPYPDNEMPFLLIPAINQFRFGNQVDESQLCLPQTWLSNLKTIFKTITLILFLASDIPEPLLHGLNYG